MRMCGLMYHVATAMDMDCWEREREGRVVFRKKRSVFDFCGGLLKKKKKKKYIYIYIKWLFKENSV